MAYGLESFNGSGVCQFSTNTSTLVKVKEFTAINAHSNIGGSTITDSGFTLYGWDGPNSPSPYWTFAFDLPVGLDNSKVFIFAKPSSSNTYSVQADRGRHSISMFGATPGSNIPRRVMIYSNLRGTSGFAPIDILVAVKPGDATPDNVAYGLEVYDGNGTADSNIIFSSRFPMLQLQEAGTVNAYSTTLNSNSFDRTYVELTGTIATGSSWSTDDAPYALISNTGWYGSIGGGYSINPSGSRTGDPFSQNGGHFANSVVWTISGSWTASTGFHLLESGYTTSYAINFFGGTSVPHDYLTVKEGN